MGATEDAEILLQAARELLGGTKVTAPLHKLDSWTRSNLAFQMTGHAVQLQQLGAPVVVEPEVAKLGPGGDS